MLSRTAAHPDSLSTHANRLGPDPAIDAPSAPAASAAAHAAAPPGIPDGGTNGYVYANGIRIHYYHATPAPGK